MKNLKTQPILIFVIMFFVLSCKQNHDVSETVKITTTTSIIKDVVQNLVGQEAEVVSLMGAGVDPHLYKASHGDINKLSNADVIIYNGLHLEGKMTEVFEKMKRKHKLIAMGDALEKSELLALDEEAKIYDPHVWFSIKKWAKCITYTSQNLIKELPQLKDTIERNTKKYLAKLDSANQVIQAYIQSIPEQNRILVTSHDAFQYYGQEFGIRVKGLQGISTLAESGLRDVTEMVNFIIKEDIKAIFVENSVPQKALKSVQEGCQGKGHQVVIGGELFSDALGEPRTPEGTYIGMLLYNSNIIAKSLK